MALTEGQEDLDAVVPNVQYMLPTYVLASVLGISIISMGPLA